MPRGKKEPGPDAARLKEAIHVAYVRAGYSSLMQLSLAADVSYDTFMNWFGGKTRPRGHELQKVATTLGVPFATLEAAYEGREPEPQPLQDAVRDLTGAVRALVSEMREDRERGQDAAAAMLRAAEALPRLEASAAPNGPPAPHETAGSGR